MTKSSLPKRFQATSHCAACCLTACTARSCTGSGIFLVETARTANEIPLRGSIPSNSGCISFLQRVQAGCQKRLQCTNQARPLTQNVLKFLQTMNTQKGPIDIRTLREFRCQWGFIYFANLGAVTSFPAKALGPGLDSEKYIFAALVVPKSRLEPLSCTSLKASRNIWL